MVSIVGAVEVDLNRNHISWLSPLAKELMKFRGRRQRARVGKKCVSKTSARTSPAANSSSNPNFHFVVFDKVQKRTLQTEKWTTCLLSSVAAEIIAIEDSWWYPALPLTIST